MRECVCKIFRERWDKMHSPLHAAAYMLEPQFRNATFGREVMPPWVLCWPNNAPAKFCSFDRLFLHVKTDFRKAVKKMMPGDHVTAHTSVFQLRQQ